MTQTIKQQFLSNNNNSLYILSLLNLSQLNIETIDIISIDEQSEL